MGVRERVVHCVGGECVGVFREHPLSLLSYFSGGTFYKKIIYCTSFVYLEKRLKLFVALSSFGWLSVGYHCHLQVPKNLEATWTAMWPLPSLAHPPHTWPKRKVPPMHSDMTPCHVSWHLWSNNSHWVRAEPFLLPALKQICLMLPYKREAHNECLAFIS